MKVNKTLREYFTLMRRTNLLIISILLGIFTLYPVVISCNTILVYFYIAIVSIFYYSMLNIISDKTLWNKNFRKCALIVHILILLATYVIIYEVSFPTPNAIQNIIQISLKVAYFTFMFGSLFYYSIRD